MEKQDESPPLTPEEIAMMQTVNARIHEHGVQQGWWDQDGNPLNLVADCEINTRSAP